MIYFRSKYKQNLFDKEYPIYNDEEGDFVGFYLRISKKSRTDKADTSPKNQLDMIYDYFKNSEYKDKDVIVYLDFDKSGHYVKNRKDFINMKKDYDDGLISYVFVKDLDRFSRHSQERIDYLRHYFVNGRHIYFIKDNNYKDLNDINNHEFEIKMVGLVAEYVSINSSKKTRDAHNVLLEKNIPIVKEPYGYERKIDVKKSEATGKLIHKKNLFVKKKEANIVRSVFNDYLDGLQVKYIKENYDFNNIQFVYRILKNKTYCGYFKYSGKWYKSDYVPVIIEESVFNRVQDKLKG